MSLTIGEQLDAMIVSKAPIDSPAFTGPAFTVGEYLAGTLTVRLWNNALETYETLTLDENGFNFSRGITAPLVLAAFRPQQFTDTAAEDDTVYYSTTLNKLVYKDSGGVVRPLT